MKTKQESMMNVLLDKCDYILKGNEPSANQPSTTLGAGYTRCILTLQTIYIQGNNEAGDDEWKFKVYLGPDRYPLQIPVNGSEYVISNNASFPHAYHVNATIFDGYFQLREGQSIGVILEAEAREIDTFFDDVSRNTGSVGVIIPSKLWFNLFATGDTPVQFQFFIEAYEMDKAPM